MIINLLNTLKSNINLFPDNLVFLKKLKNNANPYFLHAPVLFRTWRIVGLY